MYFSPFFVLYAAIFDLLLATIAFLTGAFFLVATVTAFLGATFLTATFFLVAAAATFLGATFLTGAFVVVVAFFCTIIF